MKTTLPATQLIKQAFRFQLDPNAKQLNGLASHAGGSRFAWTIGLPDTNSDHSLVGGLTLPV
ncbi:MAG: helix-turn-helix domain-containing protein [Actinomycetota bacterium]